MAIDTAVVAATNATINTAVVAATNATIDTAEVAATNAAIDTAMDVAIITINVAQMAIYFCFSFASGNGM